MTHQQQDRPLDWDDEISNDDQGGAVTVPPGEYPYEIVDLKRGRHQAKEGGKLPDCPKAELTVRVWLPDGQGVDVEETLFLHSKCEGILCQFFTSIGHRKHGDPLRPDWPRVVGSKGRCKVANRKYKGSDGEDRIANDIKKFLEPPATGEPQPQPQPQPQQNPADGVPF